MSLIPWKARGAAQRAFDGWSLQRLRDELDQVFDTCLRDPAATFDRVMSGWGPAVSMSETDTEVMVEAEVPGVEAKDLEVSVTGQSLTIAGEKRSENVEKGQGYQHCERRFGSFRRILTLPCGVDPDKIAAEFRNGVLQIRLTKSLQATPKRITIQKVDG